MFALPPSPTVLTKGTTTYLILLALDVVLQQSGVRSVQAEGDGAHPVTRNF